MNEKTIQVKKIGKLNQVLQLEKNIYFIEQLEQLLVLNTHQCAAQAK